MQTVQIPKHTSEDIIPQTSFVKNARKLVSTKNVNVNILGLYATAF